MKFCSEKQDPSKIIKNVEQENDNYYIEYLDGSQSKYYCSDKDKYEKLLNKMVEQAKERDKYENSASLYTKFIFSEIGTLISLFGAVNAYQKNIFLLYFVLLIVSAYMLKTFKDTNKKIKELEKYRIYFDLIKKGKLKISDITEPKGYYREDITINNLDEFDLSTLKYIKKYQNKIN